MKKIYRKILLGLGITFLVYFVSTSPRIGLFSSPMKMINVTFPQKLSVEQRNKFRTLAVHKSCQKLAKLKKVAAMSNKTYSRIVVDDVNKILYCSIPKVACTNWKRVLYMLMRRGKETNPLEINADLMHRPQTF